MLRALDTCPEVLTAYDVTGEDSRILEIAVRDVAHLKVVLSQLCHHAPTATAIRRWLQPRQRRAVCLERDCAELFAQRRLLMSGTSQSGRAAGTP
ncbi:Lrp/AsnC ligand binding domain-containing protein [Roseateles sp.]|uniref:Lrp/AsnC ligand binding domain-containing protein n=1 Tax=Roseateles sp. TaxID=1971397 RepID=UPI0039C98056